jgi:hypothetical protein
MSSRDCFDGFGGSHPSGIAFTQRDTLPTRAWSNTALHRNNRCSFHVQYLTHFVPFGCAPPLPPPAVGELDSLGHNIRSRHGCLLDGGTGFGEPSSRASHTGAPAYRTSAPASPNVAMQRTWYIGRISTLIFPLARSARAFLTHCETPPVNGGLTQLRCPHSAVSPSYPSGRGWGHGS